MERSSTPTRRRFGCSREVGERSTISSGQKSTYRIWLNENVAYKRLRHLTIGDFLAKLEAGEIH